MEGLLVGRNHLLAKEVRRSSLQEIFTDGWIKVDNVEADETQLQLVVSLEPGQHKVSVSPLAHIRQCLDLLNNLGHDIISQYGCFI